MATVANGSDNHNLEETALAEFLSPQFAIEGEMWAIVKPTEFC